MDNGSIIPWSRIYRNFVGRLSNSWIEVLLEELKVTEVVQIKLFVHLSLLPTYTFNSYPKRQT